MEIRTLTSTDAAGIASWRYPGRYSTYDVDEPSTLANGHWVVTQAEELIGYCCFGAPARVGGAEGEPRHPRRWLRPRARSDGSRTWASLRGRRSRVRTRAIRPRAPPGLRPRLERSV